MRSIVMHEHGGPDVLRPVETDRPEAGPGEVLIRTTAVGVNFGEVMMRAGTYPVLPPLPTVLGSEIAGVVDEVGPGVVRDLHGRRVVTVRPPPGTPSTRWPRPMP